MRNLRLGLSGLNAKSLVAKAEKIVIKMTDNPNFATPTPSLTEITEAMESTRIAAAVASNGDRFAILERNNRAAHLTQLLRLLAYYISGVADGNAQILASSGFELRREATPLPPVTAPIDFLAVRSVKPGSVKLNWKAVEGAKAYVVELTTVNPQEEEPIWKQAAICSQSRLELSDLTLRVTYWFRVCTVGKANESAWSDISQVLVA